METEDIIKLSASSNSEQDCEDGAVCEAGSDANIADTLPLKSGLKDEMTGVGPISLTNGELETTETSMLMDAKHNAEPKSSVPVGLGFSESVSLVENLVSVGMEDVETGCLADQNVSSFSDHEHEKTLISDKGIHASSTPRQKRSRVAADEQLPSVHVVYHSLTRESKQKLEELLQQWSLWHSKNCSSSNGLDMDLFTGEGTYFPALSVGLNRPSTVAFWLDNQRNKPSDMDFTLDGSAVPHYDRGYSLALTGDDSTNQGVEVNASRCFNCGSYNHALKDCPKPRDTVAVNNARKEHKSRKSQNVSSLNSVRYYQSATRGKYDGLTPGVLHSETRQLLGLRELDPPPWLNRMREIGYPPGYLDTEDQPSGIAIIGEEANNVDGEEGEILDASESEPPRKMTVKFPGINAPMPENADEKLWAPSSPWLSSSLDMSRDRLHHRYKHSSENRGRVSYDDLRWPTDYRDDYTTHGSDHTKYNSSSENLTRGHRSKKRWARDFEEDDDDDDGPPGCEPGTSPSLANHFLRYRGHDRDSSSIPPIHSYERCWPESRRINPMLLDDPSYESSFSPRDSSSMLRSPKYGRSWSDSGQENPVSPRCGQYGSYPYSSPR